MNHALHLAALTAISVVAPAQHATSPGAFPVQANDVGHSSVPKVTLVVQLASPPPVVVARRQFEEGLIQAFAPEEHAALARASQDQLLDELRAAEIDFAVTKTPVNLAGQVVFKPNRFVDLINAVVIDVPLDQVQRVKNLAGAHHVELDEPMQLLQDNAVPYVRASDGPGNKTIFSHDGGSPQRFDGSGQVIAILDTGIEHTHPTFDARFTDADFELRTGDVRPVRTAGTAFDPANHHPKVVYLLALTATSNEDDVGHGTHAATDAAGLKVVGPGLDRIPGNADDQIIEGVAPGALLMNYKVCETLFTCVGTANIVTALEDALSPVDLAGNPKPVATVINMSFGGGSGDPDSASSVASSNAALAGAVVVSSAGNDGPGEQTVGAPSAGRRVISVAACADPDALTNELDVLPPDPTRYGAGSSTGAQDDTGIAPAPQDQLIRALILGGSPDVTFPTGQHYVYAGLADTEDQVPDEVDGRFALAVRGSTVDADASGTGLFANKAAQVAAKGAIGLLLINNEPGLIENATAYAATIPVFSVTPEDGAYLRDTLGFQSVLFDPEDSLTWGTISNFPLRINLPDPVTFSPKTTDFSSRGSILQARHVKPDVTAPGQNVYGATIAAGGVSTGGGTMSDPSRFISVSGTSFSGPIVAGAAALVRQAFLVVRGETPVDDATLASGAGAQDQLDEFLVVPQSLVRAALTNTATNLRVADGETTLSYSDDRSFVHEIGSGLIHVIEAVDARVALGTNDLNGLGGPDDANEADFLPTFSFGEQQVMGTGDADQAASVTLTLQNVSGASAAGTYSLSLIDGGRGLGDVTAPLSSTNGFSVSLGSSVVSLGGTLGDQATFDLDVTVDGRTPPTGLAPAGTDASGSLATEFLWWVVASGSNGEIVRMPVSYRAVFQGPAPPYPAPFLNAIADDPVPDQMRGIDIDGRYALSWTFPPDAEDTPCEWVLEEATDFNLAFDDDAEELLVGSANSDWTGDTWVTALHPDTGTNAYSPVYTDEVDLRLEMVTPLALPAATRCTLSFDSSEDIEPDFDYGYVEVSGDGGPFLPMATFTGLFSGRRQIDISGFAGQSIVVRFRLVSDQIVSFPVHQGWYIDNIAIDVADFQVIDTLDVSITDYDVRKSIVGRSISLGSGRTGQRLEGPRTFFYRVKGLFGMACDESGPYSNVRQILVDPVPGSATPAAPR